MPEGKVAVITGGARGQGEAEARRFVAEGARVVITDVLVNNAAIQWAQALEDETLEGFRRILDVNLVGTFLGIQSAIGPMRARGGGSIINISSIAALQGLAWHAAYGSSKWAIRGLTRTAAVELGSDGIRVNAICPGPILTDMMQPDRAGGDSKARFAKLPLGRAGEVDEVAALALYLASDESSFITGGDFVVDGGSTAGPPQTPRPPKRQEPR
jgi:3alpha(or 20beta)-hydroxysteroid dehydrogenase